MKVLLVDDSLTIRLQLKSAFVEKGWEVEEAESGEKALEILGNTKFDLLITDQNMPGLHGTDMVDVLRNQDKQLNQHIKTIFLTSDTTSSLKQSAKNLGASAFALKPLNMPAFFKIVQKVIEPED